HVPLELLGALDPSSFSWQVPGLREELVTALIRSLPKAIRRSYVPAPNFATAALVAMQGQIGTADLPTALADALEAMGGNRIRPEDWGLDRVPAHLRLSFVVHRAADPASPVVDRGADLAALAERHALRTADALGAATAQVGPDLRRRGLRAWDPDDLPELPEVVEVERTGGRVHGYPALVDDGDTVSAQVFGTAEEAERRHPHGVRRLLALALSDPAPAALRTLSNGQRLSLAAPPH